MAADPPPQKTGWRGGMSSQTPRGPSAGQKSGGWAKKKDRQYEREAQRYRMKITAWSLILVILTGIFIYWLYPRWQKVPFLVAASVDYYPPIPPNAWVAEDLGRFLELWDKEKGIEILEYSKFSFNGSKQRRLDDLRKNLAEATPGGPDKDLVIIYLSMHGVVDQQNEPCLLLPGDSPGNADQWLRVREVLDALRQREEVKKLLILDCNRMDVNWGLGLLHNSFAEGLQAVFEEEKVPNLMVLNSAGPDQIGWTAPELKNSVFAYFLYRGLMGEADSGATKNSEVSLKELHAYLKTRVNQWVNDHRDDVQVPMLLPPDADHGLVHTVTPTIPKVPETKRYPQWDEVDRWWIEHARLLRTKDPYRTNPIKWEEFQHKLLRLEQLVCAGKAYQIALERTEGELGGLKALLDKAPELEDLAAFSLPLARRFRPWPPAETDAARQGLDRLIADASEVGDETGSNDDAKADGDGSGAEEPAKGAVDEVASEDAPPTSAPEETPPEPESENGLRYGHPAAQEAAWNWCLNHCAEPAGAGDRLTHALGLIDWVRNQEPEVVEVHFLRMLQQHLDPRVWQTRPDLVGDALQARDSAEEAAAPDDERVHYWVRELVETADTERRRAEDKLFVGSAAELTQADDLWKAVSGAGGNGGPYGTAVERATQVALAFKARDEAWATLPYLAQWVLMDRPGVVPERHQQLRALILDNHALAEALEESVKSEGLSLEEVAPNRQAVEGNLGLLKSAFREECTNILKEGGVNRPLLRRIAVVLAVPLVTGEDRNGLRAKYLRIAAAGKPIDDVVRTGADAPQTVSNRLARLANWPVHPALLMLRPPSNEATANTSETPPENEPLTDARMSRKDRILELAGQGQQVRDLLDNVPAQAKTWLGETEELLGVGEDSPQPPAVVRAGRSKADRLVRASASLLDHRPWEDPDPVAELRNLDLHYLLLWQAQRTLEDFWGPERDDTRPFFEIAAGGYLNSARSLCQADRGLQAVEDRLSALAAAARQIVNMRESKTLGVDMEGEPEDSRVDPNLTFEPDPRLPGGQMAFYWQKQEDRQPIGVMQDGKVSDERMAVQVKRKVEESEEGTLLPGEQQPKPPAVGDAGEPEKQTPPPEEWPSTAPVDDGARKPSRYTLSPKEQELALPVDLQAVALYRGHTSYGPRTLVEAPGINVAFSRPKGETPKLTVTGKSSRTIPVVFIFDCSGTMRAAVPPEAVKNRQNREFVKPNNDNETPTRLQVATFALGDSLRNLLETPDSPYQIALEFYGHRTYWLKVAEGVYEPHMIEEGAAFIHPSEDVETVLKLRQLDSGCVDEVMQKVNKEMRKRLGGETPLYLAIIEAIKELPAKTEGGKRHIVVITDGFNDQSRGGPPTCYKSFKDAKTELLKEENDDIQLDILGFDLPNATAADQASLDDLTELAEKWTGGRFLSAKDASSLTSALVESLALPTYTVRRASGGTPVHKQLNDTIVAKPSSSHTYLVELLDPRRDKTLAVPSAQVLLEGNEDLRLHYLKDPDRLVFSRFEPPEKVLGRFVCGTSVKYPHPNVLLHPQLKKQEATSFYVAAYKPRRTGLAVTFAISLQNLDRELDWGKDDRKFTPRPRDIWVEIRDTAPGGSVHTFYEPSFLRDMPVPVLSYQAFDWRYPSEAEIKVWFKFWETERNKEVSVRDLLAGRGLDLFENVRLTAAIRLVDGQPSVVVTEKHQGDNALQDLNARRIQLLFPSDQGAIFADSVTHRYLPLANTVRHVFSFDASNPDRPASLENCIVRFTACEDIKANAFACPALIVKVPEQ